jgi:hypothetical protein
MPQGKWWGRMRILWIGIGLVIAGAASAAGYYFLRDDLLLTCEDLLADRLRAPSTYKRIAAQKTVKTLSFDEYWKGRRTNTKTERLIKDRAKKQHDPQNSPYLSTQYFIEYDAENGYGAPLRGYTTCVYLSDESNPYGGPDITNVELDGETNLEYVLRLTREQAGSTQR